jgi:hypothetical protein
VSAEYGLQRPSPNVTVRVDSGVERVMIPGSQRPAAPQEAEFENPRGIAPAMNVTAKDYGSDGNYQRVQTGARENLGTPGADILGTATTPWGRAIVAASELKAESVVTVHGMTMQLRQAVHLGFVARDANGNYANIGAARPQTTMPQQPLRPSSLKTPQRPRPLRPSWNRLRKSSTRFWRTSRVRVKSATRPSTPLRNCSACRVSRLPS